MAIRSIEIVLEHPNAVYYAGEVVRGTVALETVGNPHARGFDIRLQGRARVRWHQGTGRHRREYTGSTLFQSQRHTLIGNSYKTALLDEAGADADFDVVPHSGVLRIPCDFDEHMDDNFRLVLRVMDYDWGKRDDLLGEMLLNVPQLVRARDQRTFRLTRRGRPEQGQITVSAKWLPFESVFPTVSRTGERVSSSAVKPCCLELCVHKATGLRKADILSQNDVYCQAYRVPPNVKVKSGKALPNPVAQMTLPIGRTLFPFAFVLRTDAPGSAELPISDDGRVRYDLYANVDKAFWKDPSRKIAITVLPNRPVPCLELLHPVVYTLRDIPIISSGSCWPAVCGRSKGLVTTHLCLPRTSFAPGEAIDVTQSCIETSAMTTKTTTLSVSIALQMYVEMTTSLGRRITRRRRHTLWKGTLTPSSLSSASADDHRTRLDQLGVQPTTIRMPHVFPSFDGGVPVSVSHRHYACLRWSYTLGMTVEASASARNSRKSSSGGAMASVAVLVAAVPPFAHVLRQMLQAERIDLSSAATAAASSAFPFSIFDNVLWDASPSETTPRLTGPEDGGRLLQAVGVPENITTFDREEDAGTIGENPPFVPLVHVVALASSSPPSVKDDDMVDVAYALPVRQAEATSIAVDDADAIDRTRENVIHNHKVDELLTALSASVDKRRTVGEWIRQNPRLATQLTPEDVGSILSKVNFALEQPSVAGEVAAGMQSLRSRLQKQTHIPSSGQQQQQQQQRNNSTLTTAHVVAAMQACPHQMAAVAAVLAPSVQDPDNRNAILTLVEYRFEREALAECFKSN